MPGEFLSDWLPGTLGFVPGVLLFTFLEMQPLISIAGAAILLSTVLLLAEIRGKPSSSKEMATGVGTPPYQRGSDLCVAFSSGGI